MGLSDLNQPVLDGRLQKLRGIADANLLHHGGAVGFDGFDADFETSRNFTIFQARPNKPEYLLLARSQIFRPAT